MKKELLNQPIDNVIEMSDRQDSKPKKVLPFMDTFYALSSDDVRERNLAALSLLRHLFSQKINECDDNSRKISVIKDGLYAFTRLLRGLCSGRASARQGYASCLSTFLELSFKLGPVLSPNFGKAKCWMEYYMEHEADSSKNSTVELSPSPLAFVRDQLMKHTVESAASDKACQRTRGGAEERDRMYGKLFGILAVIRSGTLFSQTSSEKLIKTYVSDLLILYDYKNWIREPSMHALQELVSSINENSGLKTLTALVDDVLPSFFDNKHHTWTAEKIAFYLHLQTIYMNAKINCDVVLPKILKFPLLTSVALTDGASPMATTLRDTSKIVHPRCHLVWNTIWSYLTQPMTSSHDKGNHPKKIHQRASLNRSPSCEGRRLRDDLIFGNDSSEELIKSLVNGVISFSILGTQDKINTNDTIDCAAGSGNNKITHERRALALTLIHQMCKLHLPVPVMEQVVLQPSIITKLFIDTLQTRGQSSHNKKTMQPLATYFLNEIIDILITDVGANDFVERRLAVIKALIKANPVFDSLSHTCSIAKLLGFKNESNDNTMTGEESELWESYLSFLKGQVLKGNCSPVTIRGYIDLMYSLAHGVLRVGSVQIREKIFRSILSFLMVGGFFDLKKLRQKVKKRKPKGTSSNLEILTTAYAVQTQSLEGGASLIFPHTVRVAMSSRFFSLMLESVSSPNLKIRGPELRDAKLKNASNMFDFLRLGWNALEASGAVPYDKAQENDGDSNLILMSRKEIDRICNYVRKVESTDEVSESGKAISEIACLASALLIQLLNPGSPENEEVSTWEDLNEEENDDIAEEVHDIILELSQIAGALDRNAKYSTVSNKKEESNKITSLSAVCVDILRSRCGGNSFNHSPSSGPAGKLIRLLTKSTWTACLSMSNIESNLEAFQIDQGAMSIILSSVCGSTAMPYEDGSDVDDNSDSNSDSDSNITEKDDDQVFGFSGFASTKDLEDVCNISDSDKLKSEAGSEKNEEEVQLDPSSLENLLLEDSDAEEKDLEHHAGADSALAQLIKMKQNARKAGKSQREKIELVHKLRCMALLEVIFSRGIILPQQIAVMAIRPLLHARKVLDKSLSSSVPIKKNLSEESEKRALLTQITTLLEKKITQLDISEIIEEEGHHVLISDVMESLKSLTISSHVSCCTELLTMIVKAISKNIHKSSNIDDAPFTEALREWSTNRKTNFHSFTFSALVAAAPSFSREVLLEPLIVSAKDARSSYIKAESLRMISSLFNKSEIDGTNEDANAFNKKIPIIVNIFVDALSNNDFIQARKARELLGSAKKIIMYAEDCNSDQLLNDVGLMKEPLKVFSGKIGNATVKKICAGLMLKLPMMSTCNVPKGCAAVSKKEKKSKKNRI